MAERETVYVKCDNGMVMAHDLPLPSGIADRVARGQLELVNADGSRPDESAPEPAAVGDEVPTGSVATVLTWVGEDKDRARRALEVERAAEKPRVSLTGALTALIGSETE